MTTSSGKLHIDFECCSTADLRRTGAAVYAMDTSTRVICMAWKIRGSPDPIQVWRIGQPFPREVIDHVLAGGIVAGWNVAFEHDVWNHTLRRQVPNLPALSMIQLDDTMARSAYWGLPMALDAAGAALGLPIQKDKAGHALMLRMCRPRQRQWDGSLRWWHEDDPAKFDQLCDYCANDVAAEMAIDRCLLPLPPAEQLTWALDRKINMRGVRVDTDLVDRLERITKEAKLELNFQLGGLTGGAVNTTNKAVDFLNWLKANTPYPYNDLKKSTIATRLAEGPTGIEKTALLIRAAAARASTAKLAAFKSAAGPDNRVRGTLQYYGAKRTGRWAGRLLQVQNFPRGEIKGVNTAIDCIKAGATGDDLRLLFGVEPLAVVSSCLRGCIIPEPGNLIVAGDEGQIEARVVAWLAGQQDILDVFEAGKDVYTYTAEMIGSTDRQLGKVLVLACGFGMGPPKFQATALTYGLKLSLQYAEDCVYAWRDANAFIRALWYAVDDAARAVASATGTYFTTVGKIGFERRGGSMVITLPSGRELVYRGIGLDPFNLSPAGKPAIVFMGENQYTRQWGQVRTYGGKLVENVVQAVARDVLRDAALECDLWNIDVVMSVHDELVAEVPAYRAPFVRDQMERIMTSARPWTTGLPLKADVRVMPRYGK